MTERQQESSAGWGIAALFVAIPRVGWLVLRLMLRDTSTRNAPGDLWPARGRAQDQNVSLSSSSSAVKKA